MSFFFTERKMSIKRESLKRRRSSKSKPEPKIDEDAQFGFENRAFMPQHIVLDNKYDVELGSRYCSLAQFVEGRQTTTYCIKNNQSLNQVEH